MPTSKLISGKVRDDSGFPLPGVTVSEVSASSNLTAADVFTDGNGDYTIATLNSDARVVFELDGYERISYPASSVPAVVEMSFAGVVIKVPTTKKDHTLLYVGIGLVAAALIYTAGKKAVKGRASGKLQGSKPKLVIV
jgi:Carboxypeptidase regulatory-like domain